ncbi:phage tail sheath subtilisin-like domain-containing protein [Microvirga terricola]|uniref:Phage tail protein n=1 Tax=Microvirga terricola TaxID=2719797 RepID=A0ABX0VC34_9HYPH|nr:phage tail sheath subtilisin-like domain-containing protein [Microvirga terricola]NIX75387.1 phage tail protein [Microvirga terricola]
MATQTTTFNEIPYDWLKPGTLVEVRPNYGRMGLVPFPVRALLIVQKLEIGTAQAKKLYRITRDEEGTALCGAGSIGDQMVRSFRKTNRTNDLSILALDDAAVGAAAAGKFVFSGNGDGPVSLYIGKTRVRVGGTIATAPGARAAAAVAAINADTSLPVTALQGSGAATNEVLLTAKHKGECGNAISLRVARRVDETVPSGLQVTVTAMAGGAGNPDIVGALDAIVGQWFTDIAIAWDDSNNLLAFQEELKKRYMAMGKLDAHGYFGTRGTFGQLTTKGGVTNCPNLTAAPGANRSASAPWEWAAALAGIGTFHLTNDPARQLRSLVLPGIDAPDPGDRFTDTEQDLLLRAGISTFNVLDDGTVTLDRVVTTYKQSSLGILDRAWLDIMVPKTLTRIRYDWASYVSLLYPRHKLADDDSPAAHASDAVVTPRRMHGTWASRCKLYERQGWIEDATRTVSESRFYRSENDRNRMESNQQIQIIGNLMVLAAALEFQV